MSGTRERGAVGGMRWEGWASSIAGEAPGRLDAGRAVIGFILWKDHSGCHAEGRPACQEQMLRADAGGLSVARVGGGGGLDQLRALVAGKSWIPDMLGS